MGARGAPQRLPQVIGVGKDAFGAVVDFVFGETIKTIHFTGFITDVLARAKWALAVGHDQIRWQLSCDRSILKDRRAFYNHGQRNNPAAAHLAAMQHAECDVERNPNCDSPFSTIVDDK
jgi:hypothetical protein